MASSNRASLLFEAQASHDKPDIVSTASSFSPSAVNATPASLPLFADSFTPSADFSAIAALIEEEEDEQRNRERAARDEAKLRRRQQRMDVEADAEAEAEVNHSTAAPASTTRLHRSQRRQAAQPYSRATTLGRQSSRKNRKASKPTPIQPPTTPLAELDQQALRKSESGKQSETLTAAETALFMQMWRINGPAD